MCVGPRVFRSFGRTNQTPVKPTSIIPVGPDIEGLIFDCDGTLADSMPLHLQAWRETLERHGAHFPEDLFYRLGGVSAPKLVQMLNELNGLDMDPNEVSEEKEILAEELLRDVEPIHAVVETARAHRGRLKMAVASGGVKPNVLATLRTLEIADWFDAVVTHEDVEQPKPAPDTFLEAARRIGVPPQRCLVFEDSETGLEAARRAGMRGVDVREWV